MNEPPEDPRRRSGDPRGRPPSDERSDASVDETEEDAVERRKAALRRFVEEHREWLEEMSQH